MATANIICPSPLKTTKVGPFGGQGGAAFDDGKYTTVRQVIVQYHDALIKTIQIEYDKNGRPKMGAQHGTSNGGKKAVVKLDFPNEFLISISGHLTKDCTCTALVRSLTLETNKRKYGPFGVEQGKPFSTSTTVGRIIGFFGRSGLDLDAIGAYIEPPSPRNLKIDGPYGGNGGHKWDDGVYTTVRQLVIHAGDAIDSIQIEYDKDGRPVWSKKHGESLGGIRSDVKLDYPNEFIIAILGSYRDECGLKVIRSLKIETNKKTYGPFGKERGDKFVSPKESGIVVGFSGRAGLYLDAIGVHYVPFPYPPRPLSCGPFGGTGGCTWDDGFHTTIRQLVIHSGYNIDSIQIEYDNNGRSSWSEKHGTSTGGDKNTVALNYPGEYVISISGHYGDVFGNIAVRSLKIETNKATYGPFGVDEGTTFKFPPTDGRIVGLIGKASTFLNAIGAHYEPCPMG